LVDGTALDAPVAPERPLADALQEQVQSDRQRGDDPLAQPIVGHVAQPELLTRRHREARHRAAVEDDLAVRGAPLAGYHLRQRALPVSIDARDAEALALLQAGRHVV